MGDKFFGNRRNRIENTNGKLIGSILHTVIGPFPFTLLFDQPGFSEYLQLSRRIALRIFKYVGEFRNGDFVVNAIK